MWHRKARGLRITRIMSRDGCLCSICRDPLDRGLTDEHHPRYITFDHILPRALGGTDREDNLRLAHRRCNELRGCDPLIEEE